MIPLTIRSYYSLMWGTASPEEICTTAKALGYDRLALTDTDNLYGLWPFLNACRRTGITPIVGAEITEPASDRRAICLVADNTGYKNLCALISRRHDDKPFDLAKAICRYHQGLFVLTQVPDLALSLHDQGVPVAAAIPRRPGGPAFRLRGIARDLGIMTVATPGCFFLKKIDYDVHRMLRAIDLNTSLSRLTRKDVAPPDAWLASRDAYMERFSAWPDTIENTRRIAESLSFKGPDHGLVMPPWTSCNGKTARQTLCEAVYDGARRRYGDDLSETVVDRLEHELKVIEEKNFSAYFLVVQDIVARSPRICGRGSGAASLVAYCLGITNVCPVKHNLYFERFLNPGRSDPPDIDVDFPWDERDDVLDSVFAQYKGHAAMVCNHVAFQPRMAIREVAKVFGLTDREISRVSKRLPWFWKTRHMENDMLSQIKRLPQLGGIDFPDPWPDIIRMAQQIIGVPRHLSVHSGGVVITPDPIETYVPVEPAPKGVPIIQWEKDAAEDGGLVKIDLLGNRSLGVIRDAIANIRENGIPFDEEKWEPEEDAATMDAVAAGKTMGCFYIESPATRLLQKKAKKGDFDHIVIHSSIIRPAANAFIREYIRRLHGGRWDPIHPLLADVLDETFGIMVYQEDVAKTAVALAGFSHADADGLRKIMSKKDKTRKLHDYKTRFRQGALDRGVSEQQISAVWEMMMSFSGYSFCKPHSASYARVSFQAAYLKTHYPAEFMAAVISNQGGYYSTFAYVSETRRMGVVILPPDVNKSEIRWKGNRRSMRTGLLSVNHLSVRTRENIVAERRKKAFQDIQDFFGRVKPDDTEARSLIHAGAFDALHPKKSRTELLWALSLWRKSNRDSCREPDLFVRNVTGPDPIFPAEDDITRLRREFAALGFLCQCHPMMLFADAFGKIPIVKAKDLPRFSGQYVHTAGLLITGKVVHTKHGDPMEFLTFEDDTGLMETTFFPKVYHQFCAMLDRSRPFMLYGKVDEDFGAVTVTVSDVKAVSKTGYSHCRL